MDDIKIRRLGLAGHITKMEDERIPKKRVLMGNFIIQKQVWKMLSGGTHQRS
jgi:hypothetical protein